MLKSIRSIGKRSGIIEITNAVCFVIAAIIGFLTPIHAVWPLFVIGLTGILRFMLCGRWYHIAFHPDIKRWCPQKDTCYHVGAIAKIVLYAAFFAVNIATLILSDTMFLPATYCILYVILGISMVECFRTIAHVLYKSDPSWLYDNDGHIGFLGFSCGICFVINGISCHLIATECLGKKSYIIACILSITYIVATDAAGFVVWRFFFEPTTRFYGWADILLHKFFLLTHSVAIIIAFAKTDCKLNDYNATLLIAFFAAVSVAKDVVTGVWHLKGFWRIDDTDACSFYLNILRRIAVAGWVIFSCYVLYSKDESMVSTVIFILFLIAVYSCVCCLMEYVSARHSCRLRYDERP